MCIKNVQEIAASIPSVQDAVQVVKISDIGEKLEYKEDFLAVTTYYTKVVLGSAGDLWKTFLKSNSYRVLFGTTQPAHVILIFAVLYVAALSYPNGHNIYYSSAWMLCYLAAFSIHFGTQVWMTFVSGLSLYFNIPRHTFGNIQKVLFPKYFLINAILSFVTLSIFLTIKNSQLQEMSTMIQAAVLATCFLVELTIRLYFTTPLLHLICVKTQIEKAAGVGMEIGRLNPGSLTDCPYYLKIHRTFRRTHITIAVGNMISMACSVLHLVYLSQKICYI